MFEKQLLLKKLLPYVAAVAIFIALSLAYCSPLMEGKVIQAGDTKSWEGMVHEAKTAMDNGNPTFWTGSMFCGMPTYQIGGGVYPGATLDRPFRYATHLCFAGTLAIFIGYFLGFFILLRAFKVNTWLSIIGSIAITLSSYFMIIIAAGHNTKAITLGWMAPVVAGFYLIFQKKYGWGICLTMIYTCLGLMCHPQMSYYIGMLIGVLWFAEIYIHIKEKRWKDLGIGTLCFVLALLLGAATGYGKYKTNSEYASETMRGGHSELVKASDAGNKTSGLDLDYATQWSYGIDESMTFLIPGFKGNASNYNVGIKSETYQTLVQNNVPRQSAEAFCKNVPTYWGNQPFTAGPVYMGAVVCFLFLLGLLIVKGPYKWALLVATICSVLLSWGHHFMPLTKLFFNYFPMYNKFRAVSSILVVAEITMPLLGFLALKAVMNQEVVRDKWIKSMWISAGITGGLCLFFALFGSMIYDFTASNDAQIFAQLPQWLTGAIIADRASMMRVDAFRSLVFIALAAVLMWLYGKGKLKTAWFIPLIGILVLCDLWPVDKRYFNNDNFVSKTQDKNYFKKLPYEDQLLSTETDPNYRVLNLTTNTFNESRTSYYFKSIGGYHAAKLRRYQDLIEQHISKMHMPVLDMLNTKYFFVSGPNGQVQVQRNPNAMGNAWFIDSLIVVNTPNEECDALGTINLRHSAVCDAQFAGFVKDFVPHHDSTATVRLLTYAPNQLEYECTTAQPGTIVFSEIYYPYGWKVFIDDQPTAHFRANYTLRALNVPAGQHRIRFVFDPDSVRQGGKVTVVAYSIIYVIIIGFVGWAVMQGKRRRKAVKA